MKRTMVNYWVDLVIGASFVFSAISGLVFLLPGDPATGILGISYQLWNSVHTWSSLAMIVGVGVHLALHWRWMVSMTRRMLTPTGRKRAPKTAAEPARVGAKGTQMGRRAFLVAAGTTAAVAGLLAAATAILDTDLAEASTTEQQDSVACPHGLANDPYPGKCRHYVDTTGDGFCDYSVPG